MALLSQRRASISLAATAWLSLATTRAATLEDLDEVHSRKARLSTATMPHTTFEGASPTYYWQPETLQYRDTTTGREVWRFSYGPAGSNNTTEDISTTHWSANGNRVAFGSNRFNVYRKTGPATDYTWFFANTDGSLLRPGHQLSCASWNWSFYPAWNPAKSDTFYLPGDGKSGRNFYTLYENTVSDTGSTFTPVVNLDSSTVRRIFLKKGMAPDGSKLFFLDLGNSLAFVVNLAAGTLETPNTGYSIALPWDAAWGDTAIGVGSPSWHDNYIAGAVNGKYGLWMYHLPAGSHAWWRSRLTGSGPNSAPTHTPDTVAPYAWGGELEPVNTVVGGPDPWGLVSYVSHFTTDRWGRYGLFSKSNNAPYGASLIDLNDTHDYWNAAQAFEGVSVQHHSWDAWSDWSASSGGIHGTLDYSTYRVVTQSLRDPSSQTEVAYTHTRIIGVPASPDYNSVPRPTQSPDGTKIMFASTFLQSSDDDVQLFWAVAYYPYPPEIIGAAKSGSDVRLTWDFNQGTAGAPNLVNPRTYATRGWPHEDNDRPPSPREIFAFRVWVSSDAASWSPLGTTAYNNCSGINECGSWSETAWSFDASQPNGSTRYYAVTSVEHSGLESHTLGNVWKVVLDAAGAITLQEQHATYPTAPGGTTSFYSVKPAVPRTLTVAHQQAPATAAGQYTVTWSPPADKSLVRYYNLYVADGATPTATQQRRIASVPATADTSGSGTYTYVDWIGAPDGSSQYGVTAVDFWGNESDLGALAPPDHTPDPTPDPTTPTDTSPGDGSVEESQDDAETPLGPTSAVAAGCGCASAELGAGTWLLPLALVLGRWLRRRVGAALGSLP